MMKYVNSFTAAIDTDRKVFIINLLQQTPEITEDGIIGDEVKSCLLDSFVMDKDVAMGLVSTIVSLVDDEIEDIPVETVDEK